MADESAVRPKPQRRWILAAAGAAVAVIAGAAIAGVGPFLRDDWRGVGAGKVEVKVAKGDTVAKIGRTLVAAGSVRTVKAFIRAAEDEPELGRRIQPGVYAMRERMSALSALKRFFESDARIEMVVRVREARRASSVIASIAEQTGISQSKVEAAVRSATAQLPKYANADIEGFLYPATYRFDRDASARSILAEIVATARARQSAAGIQAPPTTLGLTPRQVLTAASIIQAEAYPRDYAKVARVIYNRLAVGRALQMDSTLNYALGTSKLTFTNAERSNSSPYNTYAHAGLPPGPIGSPSEAAIKAALAPAQGDWFYFVTTNPDTGLTEFAVTDSEFMVLREKFRQWLASKQ